MTSFRLAGAAAFASVLLLLSGCRQETLPPGFSIVGGRTFESNVIIRTGEGETKVPCPITVDESAFRTQLTEIVRKTFVVDGVGRSPELAVVVTERPKVPKEILDAAEKKFPDAEVSVESKWTVQLPPFFFERTKAGIVSIQQKREDGTSRALVESTGPGDEIIERFIEIFVNDMTDRVASSIGRLNNRIWPKK